MKILVVEDNIKLSQHITQILEETGYSVDAVYDGLSGERRALSSSYDLILLDVMLPEKTGIEVCKLLRSEQIMTPVLMMTALGEVENKIEGLDSGADDYLVKPFDLKELLARVRALLRRPQNTYVDVLEVGHLRLNTASREVSLNNTPVYLTVKEFSVLEYLMRQSGQIVTREQLLEHCWDFAYSAFSNITDAYIKQLRQKLHDTDQQIIKTVRGVGYTIT